MGGRAHPARWADIRTAGLLAVAVLCLGSTVGTGQAASGDTPAQILPLSGGSWSNGLVTVHFAQNRPAFELTAVGQTSVSANQSLTRLAEINSLDKVIAVAALAASPAPWQFSEKTKGWGSTITANASVPVIVAGGEWEAGDDPLNGTSLLGYANVTFTFTLNASGRTAPLSVSYDLAVSGWPWVHANDTLGVELRSDASAVAGYWQPNGTSGLTEFAQSSGRPIATFTWANSATAFYGMGQQANSLVESYQNSSSSGALYLLRLQFGSIPGGFSSLAYDPTLTLRLPGPLSNAPPVPVPTWLITTSSLEVIAAGAAVSVILAAVAGRRRRRPDEGL